MIPRGGPPDNTGSLCTAFLAGFCSAPFDGGVRCKRKRPARGSGPGVIVQGADLVSLTVRQRKG